MCGVELIYVKGKVVAPDVAVFGWRGVLVRRLILEDFEVRPVVAAEEAQPPHHRTRMDIQVSGHPIVLGCERSELKQVLAANNVNEERSCLVQIGNCEANVLGSSESRNTAGEEFTHSQPSPFIENTQKYHSLIGVS